jgi:hypothetical protein
MAEETTFGKISQDEFGKIISPFKLDMVAVFKMIEEDVQKTVSKGLEEGLTPDEIIKEVEKIL